MWIVVSTGTTLSLDLERLTFVCLGLSSDPIQIESIEVLPDPPQPGQDLTVKVKAQVTQLIEV